MGTELIAATAPIAERPLPPEATALSAAVAERLTVCCVLCSGLRLAPKKLRLGIEPLFASGTGRICFAKVKRAARPTLKFIV